MFDVIVQQAKLVSASENEKIGKYFFDIVKFAVNLLKHE